MKVVKKGVVVMKKVDLSNEDLSFIRISLRKSLDESKSMLDMVSVHPDELRKEISYWENEVSKVSSLLSRLEEY